MNEIYPLTIVADRYTGSYSKGVFTAWNLQCNKIPDAIDDSDIECMNFWDDNKIKVGLGKTPTEAMEDLRNKLKG